MLPDSWHQPALRRRPVITGSDTRRAWVLWALVMALLGAGVALWVLNNRLRPQDLSPFRLLVPGFATVGAIVVARRRGHVVGWLFLVLATIAALSGFCEASAIRAYLTGTMAAGAYLAWVVNWLGGLGVLPLGLLLLVFPTGHLPSGRWRLVVWVLVASAGYQVAKFMVEPVLLLQVSQTERVEIANPVVQVPVVSRVILPYTVAVLSGWAALAIAALAPLARYRRAGQVERQQLKWLVFVLAVGVVGGLAAVSLIRIVPVVANGLAVLVVVELALGIPLAVGAAILRYRLYDIDRLMNRTLVYGLLTILLGGVYAGLVLTLGQLAGGIGADPPSWAVAGATLAVAALFQPARRRVQQLVDRRFNRRRYDAAKTVAAFSTRLRDEVDLDTLAAELLAVVDQTTQPTQASLWLRPQKAGRPVRPGPDR
jgi:hypothetical protein